MYEYMNQENNNSATKKTRQRLNELNNTERSFNQIYLELISIVYQGGALDYLSLVLDR